MTFVAAPFEVALSALAGRPGDRSADDPFYRCSRYSKLPTVPTNIETFAPVDDKVASRELIRGRSPDRQHGGRLGDCEQVGGGHRCRSSQVGNAGIIGIGSDRLSERGFRLGRGQTCPNPWSSMTTPMIGTTHPAIARHGTADFRAIRHRS